MSRSNTAAAHKSAAEQTANDEHKEQVNKDLDSERSNQPALTSDSGTEDPFAKPAGELDEDTVVDPHGDRVAIPGTVVEPIRTAPLTYTDNRGVERLAGGFDDGWEPAQVDPDPLLVAHNEARLAELDQAAKDLEQRQESLKTQSELDSEKGA